MPAIKLRIPNVDAARYGQGNLSQLAKARLVELIGDTVSAVPIEPSAALPAASVSVWLSSDQVDRIAARGHAAQIPGVEPTASALLHAWAQAQPANAAVPAVVDETPVKPDIEPPRARRSPDIESDEGSARHRPRDLQAALARIDDALRQEPEESPPWDAEPEPSAPAHAGIVQAHGGSSSGASTLDEINAVLGDATRSAQATFFDLILSRFQERQMPPPVIAAEAATGIGKTRVFLAVMAHWTQLNNEDKAVLAAPSYNVLFQAVNLWKTLRRLLPGLIPDATTLLGQQEFVSRSSIESALHDDAGKETPAEMAARIRQWMEAGAPAPEGDALRQPWLMRGLLEVTAGRWPFAAQCAIRNGVDDDPGRKAYEAQFRDAHDAPWVFCTHAMLATDVRRRIINARKGYKDETGKSASNVQWDAWNRMDQDERKNLRFHEEQNDLLRGYVDADSGKLPPIGLLMIDEGHLLEENFARIFATGASIASMMRTLRELRELHPTKVLASELAQISAAWDSLRSVGAGQGGDTLLTDTNPAAADAVSRIRLALKAIVARKFPDSSAARHNVYSLRETSRALDLAAMSNGARPGMTSRISWSPSIQWPSIEVGRYDISRELDFLWTLMVKDRAVLVSATLYEDFSHTGIEGTRRTLSVRPESIKAVEPVRPSWTVEPVTAFLPRQVEITDANRDQIAFYRPSSKLATGEALAEWTQRWRTQVAQYVASAYASGRGGMLVLMTSHAERAAVVEILASKIGADCLIDHRPEIGVEGVKRQFMHATAAGNRPLLVAVGAAWTGLDLSSDALATINGQTVSAGLDNVLTDLVIPNAPIGVNRTLTHQYRRQFNGAAEIGAMAILLRQGIGRLVRREGLSRRSRRLHFLDARMHDPRWSAYFIPAKRILSAYTSKREI